MVGLIPKILFDLVDSLAGPNAVAEVKRRADLPDDAHFHMNEVYGDADWRRMFAAACEVLDVSQEQAERAYADCFCRDAIKRWSTACAKSCTSISPGSMKSRRCCRRSAV